MEDKINNPKHYTSHPSGIECIEVTQFHDFCIGNAIKYLWRAGLKDEDLTIEDLKKAIWYITKKIDMLRTEKINSLIKDELLKLQDMEEDEIIKNTISYDEWEIEDDKWINSIKNNDPPESFWT